MSFDQDYFEWSVDGLRDVISDVRKIGLGEVSLARVLDNLEAAMEELDQAKLGEEPPVGTVLKFCPLYPEGDGLYRIAIRHNRPVGAQWELTAEQGFLSWASVLRLIGKAEVTILESP